MPGDDFFGEDEKEQIEEGANEDEVSSHFIYCKNFTLQIAISAEILIMMGLLMVAITLGHFLKKSQHRYL